MDLKLPDLAIGETYRGRCPKCHRPQTFTVSRVNDSFIYNCYAASCGFRGHKKVALTADDLRRSISHRKGELENGIRRDLPNFVWSDDVLHLCENFGITQEDVAFDPIRRRVVFILRDLRGRAVDAIGRTIRNQNPKWYRYTDSKAPVVVGDGDWLIIVEDIVSARKACLACPAAASMALLGTNLTTEHLVAAGQYKSVFICLDQDATDKAVAMHRRLSAFVDRCKVIMLSSDLKDMNLEDIGGLFDDPSHKSIMR